MRLLIALIVGLASTIAIALEPITASAWEKTELSLRECLSKAQTAVRGAGFTNNFKVHGNVVSGEFDEGSDYFGSIKCVIFPGRPMDENGVEYIVAGFDREQTKWIMQFMRKGFNK